MSKIKVTDIGFVNDYGKDDEVEFDTWNMHELAECWLDFCVEAGVITYIRSLEVEEND